MNKRFVSLAIFVGLIVLVLLLNHHRSAEEVVPQPLAIDTNQTAKPSAGINPNQVGSTPVKENGTGLNPETNFDEWNSNRMKQMEAVSQNVMNEWRTPIQFYGKVVDESTNPVAGVQINFSCNDLSETGTSNYKSTSDAQGMFSIQGISGKLLTVNVTKEGYYTSKTDNDSFYYAGQNVNFTPDIYNPVIFHLRKKGKGESLIMVNYPGFAHIAQLHRDGTPIEVDLLNGTQASVGTGQLRLEFWKNAPDSNSRKFDWKVSVRRTTARQIA